MIDQLKQIQSYLSESNLDAFLVLTKINRQYVSGFTGSAGAVVITPSSSPPIRFANKGRKNGGAALYVDDRYTIRARRESKLKVMSLDKLTTSPVPTRVGTPSLASPSRERSGPRLGRVGVEDRITLRELKWLKKTLPGVKLVPTKDVVENLRAVKGIREIGVIRKCQKIIDRVFAHIKKFVRVGMTETAIALEMERVAKKLGAQGMAFDSIVAFGANAAAPHHLSSNRKIGRNNFFLMDFGVLMNGYHSDFTRTLFIGKPNKKQEKVYNTVLEAQKRAIEKVRAGEKASEVDRAAREYIDKSNWRKYFTPTPQRSLVWGFTHNTGHGVGLEIHELPNFSPKSEDILKKNMIVTVEPGIYIEGWGGVRIEDMVVVSEKGPIILSKAPRELKSMII